MGKFAIALRWDGDSWPEPARDTSIELVGSNEVEGITVRRAEGRGGPWLCIEPIEATDGQDALQKAQTLVDGCLNVLAARSGHFAEIDASFHCVRDLTGTGKWRLVSLPQTVAPRITPLPWPAKVDLGEDRRSAAFFRTAMLVTEPLERLRNLSLAIEEAAKRIRTKIRNNSTDEGTYISDTIEEVYKKVGKGIDALKQLRASVGDEWFSEQFRGGANPAKAAMNDFLYQHVRCGLMHAGTTQQKGSKTIKPTYSPFSTHDSRKAQIVLPVVTTVAELYVRYDVQCTQ